MRPHHTASTYLPAVTGVEEARRNLGIRLRDVRRDAGFSSTQLAAECGWPVSKISKIEHGKQAPTEDDIRRWCEQCGARLAIPDLIATLRNINAAYLEWRRIASARRQQETGNIEADTRSVRGYDPDLIPGLLQTRDYAHAVLAACLGFLGGSDDVGAALEIRMDRQRVLHEGIHRFHFLIGEQALYTTVRDDQVMVAQLGRLAELMTLPRVVVGIIPRSAEFRCTTNNFLMYDQRLVRVETVTAGLTITQPRELVIYERTFQSLMQQSLVGSAARELITNAVEEYNG
jgi:transcriptional regulator with XRE-family HTH domain